MIIVAMKIIINDDDNNDNNNNKNDNNNNHNNNNNNNNNIIIIIIIVVEKRQMWLIDVAIPGDNRIDQKEVEKITKYQDMKVEVERLWEKKATVVPVVIGAQGAIPRDLVKHLKTFGLDKISPSQLQKAALYWEQLTSCENTSEIPRSSERTRTAGAQKHTGPRHLVNTRIKRNNNNNHNNNPNNNNYNNKFIGSVAPILRGRIAGFNDVYINIVVKMSICETVYYSCTITLGLFCIVTDNDNVK